MNDFWNVIVMLWVIIRLPNPSSVTITDSFLSPEFKFMFPISRSLADHFHVIFANLSFWMTHLFISCSVISAEQATSIHLWSEQEVFITGQSQRTREHIVSPSSLFWRISSNDPLNEPLLYSSWLSWGGEILGMDGRNAACLGVQKDWNKKATMEFSDAQLPDT